MTELPDDAKPKTLALESITYLKSPILTLLASLEDNTSDDLSCHGILDAYTILLLRLRTVSHSLTSTGTAFPALKVIAQTSDSLARCLQRDMRRASNVLDSSYTAAEHEYVLREHSTTCQLAIEVATTIFKFPALYSYFSDYALSRLLDDLLTIARSSELPVLDGEKICAVAAASFFSLQIPVRIMAPKLETVVCWMCELAECMSPTTDGSKIIYHLLSTYPTLFLQRSVDFLHEVLSRLHNSESYVRIDATVALCGYAHAVLTSGRSSLSDKLKRTLHEKARDFFLSQLPANSKSVDIKADLHQHHYLARAIKEDSESPDARGTRCAVTVISCLIILYGPSIFRSRRTCGFVLSIAEGLARSKKKASYNLLICMWKCLLWNFFHIPPAQESSQPSTGKQTPYQISRDIAFGIVKQELRDGLGASLVAGLLYARKSDVPTHLLEATLEHDVGMAISVLEEMVSHPQDQVYLGVESTLSRMLSAIGASAAELPTVTPNVGDWTSLRTLLSRHVFTAGSAEYHAALQVANRFDVSMVRRLAEKEIKHHWKELLEVWTLCVHRALQYDKFMKLPNSLIDVWQALLLVETQLTQERGHLTVTHDRSNVPIDTVASFLQWTPRTTIKRTPVPVTTIEHRTLSLCNQLWNVIRNVYSESYLVSAASALLTLTVQHAFELSDEDVRAEWSRFCAALISMSAPDFVTRLVVEYEGNRTIDVRRNLWEVMARTWTRKDPPPGATDSIDFLAIPIRHWSMNDEEITLWNVVLDHIISLPSPPSLSSVSMLAAILERGVGDMEANRLLDASKTVLLLIPRLRVEGKLEGLTTFLGSISTVLLNLYNGSPEHISAALQILKHIRNLVQNCPVDTLVTLLAPLSDGLSIWIGDEKEILLMQEHNDIVVPLYCDALSALRNIPLSSDTLQTLAHFLYSAFIRIPDPGDGPIAFCRFWDHIQPSLGDLKGVYPEDIKTALRACHDVYSLKLPQDMSFDTDSHTDSPSKELSSLLSSPVVSGSPSNRLAKGRVHAGEGRQVGVGAPLYSPLPSSSSPISTITSPFSTPRKSRRLLAHVHGAAAAGSSAGRSTDVSHISDFTPSSPLEAVRARHTSDGRSSRVAHEKAMHTPERPLKRRKLSSPLAEKDSPARSADHAGPSKDQARTGTSRIASGSRLIFDGVEVDAHKGRKRPASRSTGSATPRASKHRVMLSPEVSSPATAAKTVVASSDDYDTWEAPLVIDDDKAVVPDSQPPGEDDSDSDSLLPSFMKTIKRESSAGDTIILHDNQNDSGADEDEDAALPSSRALGKRRQLGTHTAPASFLHEPSPPAGGHTAVPLRRARTASAQLEELQNVYDAFEQDGSQLPVDAMLAASALANRIGTLMSKKLSKKLIGGTELAKK